MRPFWKNLTKLRAEGIYEPWAPLASRWCFPAPESPKVSAPWRPHCTPHHCLLHILGNHISLGLNLPNYLH